MNTHNFTPKFRLQRGISLAELSVALAIMTSCGTLLWQYSVRQAQDRNQTQSHELLVRAQKSLLAYAMLHGRLPCPAPQRDGKESCDGAQSGWFPFITTGLPEKTTGSLRYEIGKIHTYGNLEPLRVLLPFKKNEDVNTPQARAVPTLGVHVGTLGKPQEPTPAALCQALGKADSAQETAFELRTDSLLPLGHFFNTKRSMSHFQLFDHLRCQRHIIASGRAHFNAHLATNTALQGLKDIRQMRAFITTMLAGEVAGSAYGIANGLWTIQRTAPKISNAWSVYYMQEGLNMSVLGVMSAYTTVGADVINVIRQATHHARNVTLLVKNLIMLAQLDSLIAETQTVTDLTAGRAKESALSGLLWTGIHTENSRKDTLQAMNPSWLTATTPTAKTGG